MAIGSELSREKLLTRCKSLSESFGYVHYHSYRDRCKQEVIVQNYFIVYISIIVNKQSLLRYATMPTQRR